MSYLPRPLIVLRAAGPMLLALALPACGGPIGADAAGNAADAANAAPSDAPAPAPAPAALAEEGRLDRSHKGTAAPDLPFTAADGRRLTLAELRGRPVLVNLWATWCAPCKAEMPTLDALATRAGDTLAVVPISQDLQGAEAVTPYWTAAGFRTLRPYLDPDVGFSTASGAPLPTTILYDAAGREVWRMIGGMDWAGPRAAALIAEAR